MSSGDTDNHDWTAALPQTDHVRFFKSVDWAQTALGPLQQWPTALRMYTQMVMADSRAATLYWGPTQIAIYNVAFVPLAAGAHPFLMGQPFAVGFPELDPFIRPLFEEGVRSGQAQDVVESPMMVERNHYREEAFFTGNFLPLRGVDGRIEGFLNSLFEVTLQKISDRRQNMLNILATPEVLSTEAVYPHIMASLATNSLDIPMAILHEVDTESQPGKSVLRVRGTLGVPEGHRLLDGQYLEDSVGIMPLCREAVHGRILTPTDERFNGVEWLGFNQVPKHVVTMALMTGVRLFGFLTIGTNPHRPFDDVCEQFVKDLTRNASSVLAVTWDAEQLRRAQQQLQTELEFSDMKVRHLVEHASVGMAHAKKDGTLLWANDKFYSLAYPAPDKDEAINTMYALFSEDDQQEARQVWASVFEGDDDHVSAEFHLTRLFQPPVGDPEAAQIQFLAFPFKENGVTVSGMVCITDISRLKWAEAWQARIAQDARDGKRELEAFIDVVSHEMRNPLSAIVHCADTITLSLGDIQAEEGTRQIPAAILDALTANVAAASTILDCCKHQKRIIDDVLTLSRLEATLLSVKPNAVRPCELVNSVVDMFGAELRSKSITPKVIAEPSIQELSIDYLNLDGSRIVQIFINLLTNAVKFMNTGTDKNITIRYGSTLSPPRSTENVSLFPGIYWAPKGKHASNVAEDSETGSATDVYLTFSLSDTGVGMRVDEIDQIFERFRQANIMTHVTYGGSGLGLYISKELAERMGGEIGVISSPGMGSTFVFYVKTRRVTKEVESKPSSPASLPISFESLPVRLVSPSEKSSKLQTLLVEDNIVNQQVLQKQLTRNGNCAVQVANHGIEALDILCTPGAQFDVILMDQQMPVMDGLTCMREVRALEKAGKLPGRLPIIAVTANVRQEQIESAIAAGADRVMQKPFRAADLVALMREVTGTVAVTGQT